MAAAPALAALITAALAGLVACSDSEAQKAARAQPAHFVVLLDRSDGMQDESGRACEMVENAVRQLIAANKHRQTVLRVMMTGTADHVGPIPLGPAIRFDELYVRGGESVGGSTPEDLARAEGKRKDAVARVAQACREQAAPVPISPLYAALSEVVKEVEQDDSPIREVVFVTDLQETVEPEICTRIFGPESLGKPDGCPRSPGLTESATPAKDKKEKKAKVEAGKVEDRAGGSGGDRASVPPIQARGVAITICGTNASSDATAAKMRPQVVVRRDEVWQSLVADPASWRVLGSCDKIQ